MPRVRIVVVTYNCAGIIQDCLASMQADVTGGLAEAVMVDNASQDDTVGIAIRTASWLSVIECGGNRGFGAGNNAGAQGATCEFLFFLNPDARLNPGALERLVATNDEDSNIGIVGPAVRDESERLILTYYQFMTQPRAILAAFGLHSLFPINRTDGQFELRRRPPEYRADVDRLLGAAMLIKRELFESLGGFDENFFLYSEEEDLCLRTKKQGKRIVFEPLSTIVHLGGMSSNPRSALAIASAAWSRQYLLDKNYPGVFSTVARWAWIVGFAMRLTLALVTFDSRKKGYWLALRSLLSPEFYDCHVRPDKRRMPGSP